MKKKIAVALAPIFWVFSVFAEPVHLVASVGPGSLADTVLRESATQISKELGHEVVVVNKPGAGGKIAAHYVTSQPADGGTILIAFPLNAHVTGVRLSPLNGAVRSELGIFVAADGPHKSMADFIAEGKKRTLVAASLAPTATMLDKVFADTLGVKIQTLYYSQNAQASIDVAERRIDYVISAVASSIPRGLVEAGKLRLLATLGGRSALDPGVKSFKELGLPPPPDVAVMAFFVHPDTPEHLRKDLEVKLTRAINNSVVRDAKPYTISSKVVAKMLVEDGRLYDRLMTQ